MSVKTSSSPCHSPSEGLSSSSSSSTSSSVKTTTESTNHASASASTSSNRNNQQPPNLHGSVPPPTMSFPFGNGATTPAITTAPPVSDGKPSGSGGNYFTARVLPVNPNNNIEDSTNTTLGPNTNKNSQLAPGNEGKRRPANLDLSGSTAPGLAISTANGLRTPNSATNSSTPTGFPRLYSTSADSLHLKHKSLSLPSNNVEIPDIDPISPSELQNLIDKSSESASKDRRTSNNSNNTNANPDNDGDVVMSNLQDESDNALPSPPASLASSSVQSLGTTSTNTSATSTSTTSSAGSTSTSASANTIPTVLLVDVRPFAEFSVSRVQGAINICIPTTLLKRPTFVLSKFIECMHPMQTEKLQDLSLYENVVLYDQNSHTLTSNHASLIHTIWKFVKAEEVQGTIQYLQGGIQKFESQYPHLVDRKVITKDMSPPGQTPQLLTFSNGGPPKLGGFSLPEASIRDGPMKAFASNIRTAMEVYDADRDAVNIGLPRGIVPGNSEANSKIFPEWLCQIIDESNGSQTVSKRFMEIEMAEKTRLQLAFNGNSAAQQQQQEKMTLAGVELGTKNRYNNIWPFDHTRVRVLKDTDAASSPSADYINASRIQSNMSSKRYIATQGPLPATFKDFWKVVYDERIPVIMMLTLEHEGGMLKCDPYWQDGQMGDLYLTMVKQDLRPLNNTTNVRVRHFELKHPSSDKAHTVVQIQYTDWPDLGSPASASDLLALGRLKEEYMSHSSARNNYRDSTGNQCLVHCSAGCGRTGTFCTVDMVTDIFEQMYKKGEKPQEDVVYKIVHDIRRQRLSMVQNLRQYAMCYESVIQWCVDYMQGMASNTNSSGL